MGSRGTSGRAVGALFPSPNRIFELNSLIQGPGIGVKINFISNFTFISLGGKEYGNSHHFDIAVRTGGHKISPGTRSGDKSPTGRGLADEV